MMGHPDSLKIQLQEVCLGEWKLQEILLPSLEQSLLYQYQAPREVQLRYTIVTLQLKSMHLPLLQKRVQRTKTRGKKKLLKDFSKKVVYRAIQKAKIVQTWKESFLRKNQTS